MLRAENIINTSKTTPSAPVSKEIMPRSEIVADLKRIHRIAEAGCDSMLNRWEANAAELRSITEELKKSQDLLRTIMSQRHDISAHVPFVDTHTRLTQVQALQDPSLDALAEEVQNLYTDINVVETRSKPESALILPQDHADQSAHAIQLPLNQLRLQAMTSPTPIPSARPTVASPQPSATYQTPSPAPALPAPQAETMSTPSPTITTPLMATSSLPSASHIRSPLHPPAQLPLQVPSQSPSQSSSQSSSQSQPKQQAPPQPHSVAATTSTSSSTTEKGSQPQTTSTLPKRPHLPSPPVFPSTLAQPRSLSGLSTTSPIINGSQSSTAMPSTTSTSPTTTPMATPISTPVTPSAIPRPVLPGSMQTTATASNIPRSSVSSRIPQPPQMPTSLSLPKPPTFPSSLSGPTKPK